MEYNITPKEVYEILMLDKKIIEIYHKIEEYEIETAGWAFHNLQHVKNVSKVAEKILRDLKLDEETIYRCKIACLLHDIGAIKGKENHAKRSFEYTKKLFKEKDWKLKDFDSILEAIKCHSDGFDSNNIITLAIILADKLDIKKTRISDAGKKIEGNRQYAHIEDIIIDIKNKVLNINFITDGKIIVKEVNEYYFTDKVFKAVEKFSKKLDLEYNILMDGKIWKY